jgi:cytochrome d ubiquinol oxidase subunit I
LTLLQLSRWQFTLTVMFHMTFPAITVGLSILLSALYAMHWKTANPVYLQMFRFWRRIFAVGFAIGVVAGIVITFQMGLNWGIYAAMTGPIIGPIIAMEVVTAFFVEAGFIGILIYGENRVGQRTMFAATVMVAIGTILSTTWILMANSWMQTPQGFTERNGRFEPTNWIHVIFNPSFMWRYPHMLVAVLISAGLFITGIGAYYLVKGRSRLFAKNTVSIGLGVVAVLIPLQLFLGDHVAGAVLPRQPGKAGAMEGNWGTANTGYVLFAIPDMAGQRDKVKISVPCLGSFISKDLTCKTGIPGLSQLVPDKQDQPNMASVFWGFRTMWYASIVMFGVAFYATILRFRRKLWTSRRFHRFLRWMVPLGILAILGGWVSAETGRQPFVVYGYLRTSAAVSRLASAQVLFSFIGFVALYAAMLGLYIAYIVHAVRTGPERDHPDWVAPDPAVDLTMPRPERAPVSAGVNLMGERR